MPIHMDQMMQLLCHVSWQKGMKAAVKRSSRGGLLMVTTALLGGLVGGTPGLALEKFLNKWCIILPVSLFPFRMAATLVR